MLNAEWLAKQPPAFKQPTINNQHSAFNIQQFPPCHQHSAIGDQQ
jgi:hypothetical protein